MFLLTDLLCYWENASKILEEFKHLASLIKLQTAKSPKVTADTSRQILLKLWLLSLPQTEEEIDFGDLA